MIFSKGDKLFNNCIALVYLTHPDCDYVTIVPLFAKRGNEGEYVFY